MCPEVESLSIPEQPGLVTVTVGCLIGSRKVSEDNALSGILRATLFFVYFCVHFQNNICVSIQGLFLIFQLINIKNMVK